MKRTVTGGVSTATRTSKPAAKRSAPKPKRAIATKTITVSGKPAAISVYDSGGIEVVYNGITAAGKDVATAKADVADKLGLHGPRLALIYKWITMLSRTVKS